MTKKSSAKASSKGTGNIRKADTRNGKTSGKGKSQAPGRGSKGTC